jgi:hypothetical protein
MAIAAMMVLFLNAARVAMITFDPYLSSRPLASAMSDFINVHLILDNQYYTFSSAIFYTNRLALLLNGRKTNLEYGSYAPGAPKVFIDDEKFVRIWRTAERYYLLVERPEVARFENLVGKPALHLVKSSGGKFLFTNHANLH